MLTRANRVVSAADYRATVRGGRRFGTEHTVIYLAKRGPGEPTRFGFIVAKSVGGAVRRNVVRRRMKAIAWELLPALNAAGQSDGPSSIGRDIVIRALPGSDKATWSTLQSEIAEAVERGVARG